MKFREPEVGRRRADGHEFDPVIEGARFRLTAEVAEQIWWVVSHEATDASGELDLDRATRRFREVATRAAARHGRLRTAAGKVTRLEAETRGRESAADVFRRGVPGRRSLVEKEARRQAWRAQPPAPSPELPHQREVEALVERRAADDTDADAWLPLAAPRPASGPPALRVLHGGAGTSLPADLVAQLDDALGAAAQRARIHTGPDAEALADSHHAHAVTFGEDVYFGARAYQPDTVGGQQLIAHEVTHVAQSLRGEQVRGAAKSKSYNTALNGGGLLEGEAELSAAVELDKVTGGYLKGQLKAVVGAGGTKLSGEATFAKGPLRGIVDKFTVTYDVKTKELTAQVVLTVDKLSRLLPKGISASGTVTLDATKNPAGVAFSTASAVDVKIDSLLGGALQDLHIGDGFGATFCPEGDFEIGALKVTFAEGSRLTVDSKTGITGALKGAVQIGALPKIELDVGAGPKGITVHAATTISLADINRQLAGEVRIAYKGGPADRKLSFIADHPRLKDIPGADILAKLEGQSDGNEITGALSARKGARFEHEGVHAIVEKGELALLTGHKLEGDLEGTIHGSVGSGHVTMGLHDGAFSWGAKGKIDLAALTNHVLIGEVEGEAGTNADATFQSKGITFGPKALRGIKITSLSGNLTKRTFKLNVDVTSLADSIAHQIPGVDVKIDHAAAELVYAGGIKIETAIQGHAALRARNNKELASGHFGLTLHEQEFGGLVHIDKFEVSEYLKGNNLFVDLRAGVKTGTVMFDMPGLAHGTADGLVFDVKNRHYGFDAQIDFDGKQQLITGTKLHVKLADGVLSGDVTFANEYVRGAAQLTTGHGGTTFHGHLDKKLGGLGKLGDAFTGAELSYSKVTGLVAKGGFNLGGLSTMLGAGSKVELSYANHKLAVDGTLHAGHLEHVTWGAKNELKMHWEQGGRLKVAGQLDATVANLAEVSLKIAANAGGAGAEGSGEAELDASAPRFFLSGRITGKGLGKFFPGVHFSDPTASVHVENGADGKWSYKVDELAGGRLIGIDGIDEADATFTGNYVTGKGLTASAKLNKLRIKQFTATGAISIKDNHLEQTELGMEAAFPGVKLKGNVQVAKGELGHLSWKAHVEAVPSEGGPLSWVKSGSLDATMEKGKLTEAKGSLALKPPSFLPVENPHIDLKYDGEHIVGTLDAEFASPLHKTKKGTLKVTIGGPKKFEAEIHMPAKLPGMKEAEVYGKVTADGHVEIGAVLEPDGLPFIKKARVSITFANGAFVIGGFLTIAPTDDYEVELGVEYDITNKQFHVKGLEPKHDDKAKDTPLLSLNHDKHLPNVPLFGIGVLNVVLTMRASVGININKPFIKFETPKLIGGLEALDEGRMPGIEFGGKVGIGAELFAEFGIGIAGQVQLLIASAEMGIEGVLHAGLTMNLQSDIHGKFEHGKGVELTIDPSVSAALKLTASLNAFLHAEALWWTIIDKHWPLASMDLADIPLGEFHPFDPFKLTLGGTGGTTIETPKIKDPTAMTDGASKSAQAASDEASNAETKAKVKPVLARIREVAKRFEQKPDWKGKGLTIPYVEFDSWYGIDQDKWDTYREVADNAEQMVPEEACKTPTERLSKAVAILSKRNPVVAGMVVLAYERAQVAADGYNPDTGEDVVAKQKEIEALVMIQYAEAMAAWQEQVAAQAASHEQAKTKQTTDFAAAEAQHTARTHETQQAFERQTQQATDALQAQQAKLGSAQAGGGSAPAPAAAPPIAKPVAPVATKLQKPEPIAAPAPIAQPAPPAPVPAITLPAIPQDPGVSPPSAAMVPKAKPAKVVQPPPAKGTPVPAAPSSQAAALGGKSATSKGGGGGGGAKAAPQTPLQPAAGGGGGSTAPGPVVAEGPPGIIAQDKSLEQRRAALGGK
ncbi:MAG: DUF4157 domain-containing protein, partial [Deltaproteobacteria bacterium]|nr:DUF4157 domain-containing protein [Deltaproteobacteria bacterium]